MRSMERIDKMRLYRQKILDFVLKNFNYFNYYIILDSDISGSIFLDGFFSSFDTDNWDAVFAQGITTLPFTTKFIIYDGYAFIGKDQEFNYKNNDLDELVNQNKYLNNNIIDSDWIQCKSGYNGMCIFKIDSILSCSYYNNQQFKCEHIDLFYSMHLNNKTKIYFNPSLIIFAGHQGKKRIESITK